MYQTKPLFLIFCLVFTACQDTTPLEQEIQKLNTEKVQLSKELNELKSTVAVLKQNNDALNSAKDTLQIRLKKQAELEIFRAKALDTPLEIAAFTVQNETEKGAVLNVKSPFKKNTLRYLSFKATAINNKNKIGQPLEGKLYAIYRLGTLVQRMANAGTFIGNDGKKYIYTNAWNLASDTPSVLLDKGIGDATRGIFEKGNWTLELWFEVKNSTKAYKLAESSFEIICK